MNVYKRQGLQAGMVALLALLMLLTACSGKQADDTPQTRTVQTAQGEVEIPEKPQRIVALYYHHMLTALGAEVVGANLTWWGGSPFLTEQEQSLTDVGGPPSLEAVAALNPDLIIMNTNNLDDYEQFAKIAPSVLIPYNPLNTPYDDTKAIAALLGKPETADELEAAFESKAEQARESLQAHLAPDSKAAIIRIDGTGGQFTIFGYNYGRGGWPIYKGLQFEMPARIAQELEAADAQLVQELSIELLPDFLSDADYIFVSSEGEATQVVLDSQTWQSLPAAEQGRVVLLDASQYFYFDPISIDGQLDLIVEALKQLPSL